MLSALMATMFLAPLYCEAYCPSQEQLDEMHTLLKKNNSMLTKLMKHLGIKEGKE